MNKKFLFLLVFIFVNIPQIFSLQDFGYTPKAKSMGNVFYAIADTVDTIYYNPAGISTLKTPQISFGYQALWLALGIEERIGNGSISFGYPLKKIGSFAVGYSNFFTSNLYEESIALLNYSNKIIKNFYLGLNIKYLSKTYNLIEDIKQNPIFSDYGNNVSDIGIDFGLLYKSKKVSFGLKTENINQPKLTLNPNEEYKENIKFGVGFGFYPLETFTLGLDLGYNNLFNINLGLEKKFVNENISVRAGSSYFLSGVADISLGFGYRIPVSFGGINLNYSFSYPINSIVNTYGHHFLSFLLDFEVTQGKETVTSTTIPSTKPDKTKVFDENELKQQILGSSLSEIIKIEISKNVLKKDDKELVFTIEISTQTVGWQLIIQDNKNKVIKKFLSKSQKEEIKWDLKSENGKYITPGKYNFFVVGLDKKENKIESKINSFILSEKLQVDEQRQEIIICPNCGAENMKGERFCVKCREPL